LKTFRSLVVVKRPHTILWSIMRDHLPDLAAHIADIEDIFPLDRSSDADGVVHIVNRWRVRHQVPPTIRVVLKTDDLSWIDRNTWDARTFTCAWTIEPDFLTEHIACSGHTTFASAMAGQGARVAVEGGFDLKPGLFGGLPGGIERLVAGFLESIVTTVIPRNLRGVVEAAAAYAPRD
jgi:hypothetical protein